ncbi:MAG: hypothetical protein ACRBFS_06955 [Aureispira sp.]
MKRQWISIIGFLLGLGACGETGTTVSTTTPSALVVKDSTLAVDFFQNNGANSLEQTAFLPLLDSSYYTNKDSFIGAFKAQYQVPGHYILLDVESTPLYGAIDSIFCVRFDQRLSTASCQHPLKEQHFIFDRVGQLLYKKEVHSAQFLPHAIDSTPVYLTIEHNCEGEGQHYAYVLQEGQLVNVLNVFFENMPMTFDAKEDSSVFQAAGALEPFLEDCNKDGYLDLALKGKRVQLYSRSGKRFSVQRPYRRDPVQYYFLYEPAKEIFIFDPNFRPVSR